MPPSPTSPTSPDADGHAELRVVVRFVAALIAVVLAGALGLLVHRSETGTSDDSTLAAPAEPLPAPTSPGDPAVVALPHTLGPLAGTDVAAYRNSRQAALASADGSHAAVVSFAAYLTETEARDALQSVSVRALLVAPPGGDPAIVRTPLATWAVAARADVEDQRRQFEQLLASKTIADDQFVAQYRAEVDRLTRLQRTIDPKGRIVFGAVVVGEAADLRALATKPGVRLVDAAAGAAVPADADIRGLRPEETTTAGDPATRPPA